MREILGKIGRLCENHVEKIVLVVAGIISAWLFITGVLFTPDVVQYQGKKVPVTRIDEEVSLKLDQLRNAMDRVTNKADETKYVSRLNGPVGPSDPVLSVLGNRPQPKSFAALFHSPLAYLAGSTQPGPAVVVSTESGGAQYRLPAIPRLTDVALEYLRAAAYVPLVDVTQERPYAVGQSDVNDIDLVTVEAKLDVAGIYRQFQEFFNGSEVQNARWRDAGLATPKFAALQLQRQEVQATGLWSEWTTVPPNRICPYRRLFDIVENVKDLPVGGMGIRMASYDSLLVTMALLQPESYQIASADERWYPPSFYGKFKKIQRQIEAAEQRKEREDAKNQAATAAGTATNRRGDTGRGGTMTGQGGRGTMGGRATMGGMGGMAGGDAYGGGGRGGRATMGGRGGAMTEGQGGRPGATTGRGGNTRTGRPGTMNEGYGQEGYDPRNPMGQQGPSIAEVEIEYQKNLIVPPAAQGTGTNLAMLKEPVLVWAIDDTVQPGTTYRYRMRVGVFNPVAGSNRVAERDAARKDQVILWSEFTPVTSTVYVHKKMYFFARDVQEQTRTASVEVARYLRGYWRTETFQVRPGETIGKEVETKKERRRTPTTPEAGGRLTAMGARGDDLAGLDLRNANLGLGMGEQVDDMNPPTIDFSTHVLLVDLVPVSDWSGGANVRPRDYVDLLYTEDGTHIEHMASNSRGWPRVLIDAREEIANSARKDKKPLKAFGPTGRGNPESRGGRY